MKIICPHCNKEVSPSTENVDPEHDAHYKAWKTCLSYGSRTFYFECVHCHKRYSVYYHKVVLTEQAQKSIEEPTW